ncbi:MAG: hypothetical protein Q4D40_04060 [Eubacteriales bacterium]|nr:hypothetical protein [Eubacteriales bacterium]
MDNTKGYRFIEDDDREIDIMDLFWRCVSSWRFIIAAMIAGAVLGGGFKYAKNLMTENAAEFLIGLTKDIEAKDEYISNSIYANLDPYRVYSTQLTYYIELPMLTVSREEAAASLLNAYRAGLSSNEMLKAAADKMGGIDTRYIRELIRVTGADESTQINTGRSAGTVFTVEIDADTEVNAGLIADSIDTAMQDYSTKLDSEITEHELISLDRSSSTMVDTELAELQKTIHKDLYTMKNEAENLIKSFNDLQRAYVKLAADTEETADKTSEGSAASVTAAAVSPKAGLAKFALIGLAAGLLLSGMVVVMIYLLDGKIKTEDELETGYGLRILGKIHSDKDKKRSAIDELIYRLRNGRDISVENENTLLLTNIRAACEQRDISRILITSSGRFTETEKTYAGIIADELKKSGVDTVIMENLSESAETFEQMNELGVAMLLEERNMTRNRNLEKALKYCDAQEVTVIGTAVF